VFVLLTQGMEIWLTFLKYKPVSINLPKVPVLFSHGTNRVDSTGKIMINHI